MVNVENSFDVFRYFEGGREGVQKRFGEGILKGLEKMSAVEAYQMEEYEEFEPGVLRKIANGNYGRINSQLIQALAPALDFTFDEGFGEIVNLSPEDKVGILEQIRRDEFWSGGGELSNLQLVEQYLFFRAVFDL